ncbi:MAG: heparinase II/III family protein [Alphaproteobacteria bacterium]|nr:heparinase II/III family protein [Alphaproteobacteria bacterium]
MISSLLRKARQVAEDATLRRWLFERALGKTPGPPAFLAHHPPYLTSLDLGAAPEPDGRFPTFLQGTPTKSASLDLAGRDLTIEPDQTAALFDQPFDDIEQLLALHRFSWIDEGSDPNWVATVWQAWRQRFGVPDGGWAWHPYTAAERAIHLLAFAQRHGLPEPYADNWRLLAAHALAIASRLEYFGPHYTGNHLANNGRGLFRLGTAFGWTRAAELGGRILLEEAQRIFGPSGVLIEGSAHYHLLLSKNYAEAAEWAKQAVRPETDDLEAIAAKARHAAGGLLLSGGLPLIGDISPDLAPERLLPQFKPTQADLSADGWHRLEAGDWSLLLYAAPDGWPPMPGHGHQDLGSFELHWRGVPLIVDAGRGHYGDQGEAALFRQAVVHNGITISRRDPRPTNRPYYAPDFRSRMGGQAPSVRRTQSELTLDYSIQRTSISRNFAARDNSLSIKDVVSGNDPCAIERALVVPHPLELCKNTIRISTPQGCITLTCDSPMQASPLTRWTSYGRGQPATRLFAQNAVQPLWQGSLMLEVA